MAEGKHYAVSSSLRLWSPGNNVVEVVQMGPEEHERTLAYCHVPFLGLSRPENEQRELIRLMQICHFCLANLYDEKSLEKLYVVAASFPMLCEFLSNTLHALVVACFPTILFPSVLYFTAQIPDFIFE